MLFQTLLSGGLAGYHYDLYDEEEENLKFDPYTNTYDDGYGDLYFNDVEQEVATCRLGEDGKPSFNGKSQKALTRTFDPDRCSSLGVFCIQNANCHIRKVISPHHKFGSYINADFTQSFTLKVLLDCRISAVQSQA